ncbi:MAG: MOSC domain-containing protein [Gemmatimonadales bacterium]
MRVASLHRYPVKSMAGETVETAVLTERGLLGDRAYALFDRETAKIASAKRPRRWPSLLGCGARFLAEPEVGGATPEVEIEPPDGRTATSGDRDGLDGWLSAALGRPVSLVEPREAGARFEYHWPDEPGLRYQGRLYRDEITDHEMPTGTFFDSAGFHLLTTASLAALHRRAPGLALDPGRFRANLVVSLEGDDDFPENAWVGRVLRLGEARVRVTKPCIRCVMVNLEHRDADADRGVLAAAFRHNEGNLGVKGEIVTPGRLAVGDPVLVE